MMALPRSTLTAFWINPHRSSFPLPVCRRRKQGSSASRRMPANTFFCLALSKMGNLICLGQTIRVDPVVIQPISRVESSGRPAPPGIQDQDDPAKSSPPGSGGRFQWVPGLAGLPGELLANPYPGRFHQGRGVIYPKKLITWVLPGLELVLARSSGYDGVDQRRLTHVGLPAMAISGRFPGGYSEVLVALLTNSREDLHVFFPGPRSSPANKPQAGSWPRGYFRWSWRREAQVAFRLLPKSIPGVHPPGLLQDVEGKSKGFAYSVGRGQDVEGSVAPR